MIPQELKIRAMIELIEEMRGENETVDAVKKFKNMTKEMMNKCSLRFEKLNSIASSDTKFESESHEPTESSSGWRNEYDNNRKSGKFRGRLLSRSAKFTEFLTPTRYSAFHTTHQHGLSTK